MKNNKNKHDTKQNGQILPPLSMLSYLLLILLSTGIIIIVTLLLLQMRELWLLQLTAFYN